MEDDGRNRDHYEQMAGEARNEALEEAAAIAEEESSCGDHSEYGDGYDAACRKIAELIRDKIRN